MANKFQLRGPHNDNWTTVSELDYNQSSFEKRTIDDRKPTHIACRRWFQKTYGNTYFSSYVSFDDGSTEQIIAFEYGYGDHCLDQSLKALAKAGYVELPAPYSNGCSSYNTTVFLREVVNVSYDVTDVQRKRDL